MIDEMERLRLESIATSPNTAICSDRPLIQLLQHRGPPTKQMEVVVLCRLALTGYPNMSVASSGALQLLVRGRAPTDHQQLHTRKMPDSI